MDWSGTYAERLKVTMGKEESDGNWLGKDRQGSRREMRKKKKKELEGCKNLFTAASRRSCLM